MVYPQYANARNQSARRHSARRGGLRHCRRFSEGSEPIAIKPFQNLRGLGARWIDASLFWRTFLQPIDSLLSHAGEAGAFVRFGHPELSTAFWATMGLVRSVAKDETVGPTLLKDDIRLVLGFRIRFAGPTTCAEVRRPTAKETLKTAACIN